MIVIYGALVLDDDIFRHFFHFFNFDFPGCWVGKSAKNNPK